MSCEVTYPHIASVLGNRNAVLLDQHAQEIAGKSDEEAVKHFDTCPLADWCALNSTVEYRDRLELIEWSLGTILSSPNMNRAGIQSVYSIKAQNRDQFNELLAEIATATACALRATLLALEWKTGKSGRGEEYDADVRMEVCGQPVNLEVTLRTDSWLKDVAFHAEDVLDSDGNLVGPIPSAQSRQTLTERQRDDLQDAGIILPKRVPDVAAQRKATKPKTVFISDPDQLPEGETSKAYCADGDNTRVESKNVRRCIEDKAKKFNADGYHVVVIATMQPGFPTVNSVFDTVFGPSPHIKHHGLFENGLCNEIVGVLYLPVFQQLQALHSGSDEPTLATYFPNHNAAVSPTPPVQLQEQIAHVFGADVRRGWMTT